MGLRGIPNYFPSLYGSFLQPFSPLQFIYSFTYVLDLITEPLLPFFFNKVKSYISEMDLVVTSV